MKDNKVSTTLPDSVMVRLENMCEDRGIIKSVAIRSMIVRALFTSDEIAVGDHLGVYKG